MTRMPSSASAWSACSTVSRRSCGPANRESSSWRARTTCGGLPIPQNWTMATAGLWFLAGYLVGSVPVGLLVGRLAGVDIRRYGTGNIGASNVLRNLGLLPAGVVAVASFAQGLAPAAAAGLLTGSPRALAGAA